MKNLTRICLMVLTFFISSSFESAAFKKATNVTRKKNDTQLKKNLNLNLRCCTEYFIDVNNCGTTMYVAATACTEGTNVSMDKICEAAYTAAMKNFTHACEEEGPTN